MTLIIISTFVASGILLFLSYFYIDKWIHYGWRIGAVCLLIEIFIAVWLG